MFLSILPGMYWFLFVSFVFLNKTNDFQENWKFSLVKPMISKKRQLSAKTSPGFGPRLPQDLLYYFFVLISICVFFLSSGLGISSSKLKENQYGIGLGAPGAISFRFPH